MSGADACALAAAKAAARKAGFAARKAAQAAADRRTEADALIAYLAGQSGRVIAGYWPINSEIDPRPALHALAGANQIVLPVIEGPGRPLSFRAWHPGAAMITGAFGAEIPAEGATLVPDIVIVPMVAFDAALYRLGYGGGFYDRTLQGLRAGGSVLALGFAYAGQEVPVLPRDANDQPLDLLVTEVGPRGPKGPGS